MNRQNSLFQNKNNTRDMHKHGEDSVSDGLEDIEMAARSSRTVDQENRQDPNSNHDYQDSRYALIHQTDTSKHITIQQIENQENDYVNEFGNNGIDHDYQTKNKSVISDVEANDSDEEKKNLQDEDKEEDGDEIDDHALEDFKAGGTNHELNMTQFMKNYGINIDIPGFYIVDTKIFPDNTCMNCFQVIKHVIQQDSEQRIKTFNEVYDGSRENQVPPSETFKQVFGLQDEVYDKENLCLRWINYEDGVMKVVREIPMKNQKKVMISFSPNGKLFTTFNKKTRVLRVYQIDSNSDNPLNQLMDEIEENTNLLWDFNYKEVTTELLGCRATKWSPCSQYLALSGFERISVIDMSVGQIIANFSVYQKISKSGSIEISKKKQYRAILDVEIVSKCDINGEYEPGHDEDYPYRCDVALLMENTKSVLIKNIRDFNPDMQRQIPFQNSKIEDIQINISQDLKKIVYFNGTENYILSEVRNKDYDDERISYQLNTLTWLAKKNIFFIIDIMNHNQSEFLFICGKDYDQDIDIMCSWKENFKMRIPRQCEPNSIKVYDAIQNQTFGDPDGLGEKLFLISTQDEELNFDVLLPQQHRDRVFKQRNVDLGYGNDHEQMLAQQKLSKRQLEAESLLELKISISQQETEGLTCNWPYVSYLKGHYQYIFNVNDGKIINRVQMPHDLITVPFSHITESLDLFLLAEFDDYYTMYQIDLDCFANYGTDDNGQSIKGKYEKQQNKQIFKLQQIMTYTKESVNYAPLLDFHVRASSDKDDISLNRKLAAFFLQNKTVYQWFSGVVGHENEISELKINKGPIYTTTRHFDKINDNSFFIRTDKKDKKTGREVFSLMNIQVEFSSCILKSWYDEKQGPDIIKAYSFDYLQKILVLMKVKQSKKKLGKIISIIDLNENNQILYQGRLKDKELAGRLKTALYVFIDGHYYYNNHCIKIRYDLLRKKNVAQDYSEEQVFDFYDNVLQLQVGEQIQHKMPIITKDAHKLIFVIRNKKSKTSKKIFLLPFLHERKIQLHNSKSTVQYFQTTLQTTIQKQGEADITLNYLISMNLSDHKFYVYTMKGLLKERVNYYRNIHLKYGNPRAVSNNGQVFIFKQSFNLELHVIILNISSTSKTKSTLSYIKTINVEESIKNFIQYRIHNAGNDQKEINESQALYKEVTEGDFKSLHDPTKCKFYFKINDNMDIIIQIDGERQESKTLKKKLKLKKAKTIELTNEQEARIKEEKDNQKRLKRGKGYLIYFQKGTFGIDYDKIDKKYGNLVKQGFGSSNIGSVGVTGQKSRGVSFFKDEFDTNASQSVFLTKDHDNFENGMRGMAMNKGHVFFWNNYSIWYFQIKDKVHKMQNIGLYVDPEDQLTKVKTVRTSSTEKLVSIIVRQSKHSDKFITWNIATDCELESLDMELNPNVIWDEFGNAYATQNDIVYIAQMGVVMKCYDVKEININQFKIDKFMEDAFGFHQGYKFDGNTHSWIFLREYISLSYSYMTFAINYKAQKLDTYLHKAYIFDVEQYNFIINKRTFLHDALLVDNSVKLNYILKTFEKLDPILLDQIQYYYINYHPIPSLNNSGFPGVDEIKYREEIVTPLHIAFNQQNNKSINIILKYMAMLDYSQFKTFMDIWHHLIDFSGFSDFLNEQTFFNMQMANKQTLKVKTPHNDHIVAVVASKASYVDEAFFIKNMKQLDDNDYNSYPVKVVGLEVGWLIKNKDTHGKKFLQAILSSENLDLYEVDSVRILIEWLYDKFKYNALWRGGPLYIFSLVIFLVTIWVQEAINITYMNVLPDNLQTVLVLEQWDNSLVNPSIKCPLPVKVQNAQDVNSTKVASNPIIPDTTAKKLSEDEDEILKKRTEYAQMKFNSFTNNTQLLNYKNLGVFIESKGLPKNETYLKNLIKKFDLNCDDQTDENEFVEMMLANKVEATVSEATLNTLQEEIDDKKLKELHQMLNKIQKNDKLYKVFGAIGIFVSGLNFYLVYQQIINAKETYWRSQWAYFDFAYIILNILVSIQILITGSIPTIRIFQAFLAIIIWLKSLYFLQLIDAMSHLILIIFKIFHDIMPFMMAYCVIIFAFSNAFYIIGQNQVQFDQIDITDDDQPKYRTFIGSIKYIYEMTLGEFGQGQFEVGQDPNHILMLWILFIIASFIIIIHMLNMLVAIMGNTFSLNSEIKEQVLIKAKLKFTIDNWWIKNAIAESKEAEQQISYLVCAMFNEEDEEDVEILKDVEEEIKEMNAERKDHTDNIMNELKKIKTMLASIESK